MCIRDRGQYWKAELKYREQNVPELYHLETLDVSAYSEVKAMEEPVRWVSKAEAAAELEVSLSTLDRMIRRGEVEVRREGRRVYVRMYGPEYLGDEELLRRSVAREEELRRTVRELEQSVSQWQMRASELERERDEARELAATANRPYQELEEKYLKEVAGHKETKESLIAARVGAFVLLALLVGCVLLWWFVLR